MDAIETEQLLDDVASVVKHAIEQAVKPLQERIVSLEKQVAGIPEPERVDVEAIAVLAGKAVAPEIAALKADLDAMSEKVAVVASLNVPEIIAETVKALPEPRHGKDADLSEVKVLIDTEVSEVRKSLGEVWPAGQVAKMVEDAIAAYAAKEPQRLAEDEIRAIASDVVEKRVSALPEPKDGQDGKDADPELIKRMVDEAVAALPPANDGKDGRDGRDGIDAVDALIDMSGDLIFTFSDGRMKNVGCVVGMDGVDIDIDRVQQQIAETIKSLWDNHPKPKDGADGLGFDDMEILYDGERKITLKFQRGDTVKELLLEMPVLIDRGVYKEGQTYTRGDGVTWGGSFWICQAATTDKPDAGTKTWRLAVKKGRDGKPEPVKT